MAQVSAAMVKQLREKTQLPMMDCKKALQQAEGDLGAAEDILRKSGALAAVKKAGRETAEGRVAIYVSDDNSAAGIVEVRCETAPVANTDSFIEMCDMIARHIAIAQTVPSDTDELLGQRLEPDGKTARDLLNDVINKIRENMQVARFARLEGEIIAGYQHHNGQVAVVVQLGSDGELTADQALIRFGRDLCMHVTAAGPMALTRDGLSPDLVEKEKQIIQAQVAQQAANKPPQIVEKIVIGKLNKWYNERVLVDQPFVKDDKKTVKQAVSEFSKTFGRPVTIKRYLRYEVGGGG